MEDKKEVQVLIEAFDKAGKDSNCTAQTAAQASSIQSRTASDLVASVAVLEDVEKQELSRRQGNNQTAEDPRIYEPAFRN